MKKLKTLNFRDWAEKNTDDLLYRFNSENDMNVLTLDDPNCCDWVIEEHEQYISEEQAAFESHYDAINEQRKGGE